MHGETLTRPVQSHFSQPDIIKDFHQFLNDKEMNIKQENPNIYYLGFSVDNYAELYNKQFILHTPLRRSYFLCVSLLLNIPKDFRKSFLDESRP